MGCKRCADTGRIDDGGIEMCPVCFGTGNITAQHDADAELGRMVRAIYERGGPGSIASVAVLLASGRCSTLDEAARKTLEAK